MSDDKAAGIFSLTREVELNFPNIFVARKFRDRGDAKFDAMLVFDADNPDLAALKALAGARAKSAWGANEDGTSRVPFADIRFPFKAGEKVITDAEANAREKGKKVPDNEHLRGKVTITCRSQYNPKLTSFENGKWLDYENRGAETAKAIQDRFYSGGKVLAELNIVANKVDDKYYVSAYLNMVGTLNRGTRRAGGKSGAETFSAYAGHVSSANPTAGMEEIPV